jgi:hypothetical protein
MHEVDPGHHLEQLAGQMKSRAVAARRHGDLARIGFGERDQLGHGLRRNRGVDHKHERHLDRARDRSEIADDVEVELLVERRIDGSGRTDHHEGIAVGRRPHGRFGRDIGAGAGPVLDGEGLAELLRQRLRHQPRGDVDRARRRKADEDSHRPRGGISLRPRHTAKRRHHGST